MITRCSAADAHPLIAVAKLLADELAQGAALRDGRRELPYAAFKQLSVRGISAARIPAEHSGADASYTDLVQMFVHIARGDSNVAQALIPHFTALERIRLMGSDQQRARYFELAKAGVIFAGSTSERGGKFRTDTNTALTVDGDGYRLNGTKFYSTGSLFAQYLRITATDEQGGRVSVYIPHDRAGVVLHDDWDGFGQRLTASGTSEFNNVRVEATEVIPFAQWESQQRNYASSASQLLHATIEAGIAQAVLADAITWTNQRARPVRESGVDRAVDDPYVQQAVGHIAAHAHAAEATLLRAAGYVDRAACAWYLPAIDDEERQQLAVQASVAVAEARIITHDVGLRAAELLYEIGGASTTLRESNLDRHWRNARTHTTHDPVSYKFKVVGNYFLTGTPPPISLYY